MRYAMQSLALILRTSWRVDRRATIVAFFEGVGQVLEYLLPLFVGFVVTGLSTRNGVVFVLGLLGIAFGQGATFVLSLVGVQARFGLNERIGHEIDQQIAHLSGEAPTLDHLQDPEHQDQMHALRERMGSLGMAYNSLVNTINGLIRPVVTILVAAATDVRLLLLLVVAVPASFSARATVRWEQQAEDESSAAGRRSRQLAGLTVDPVAAAELRTFGARAHVRSALVAQSRIWRKPFTRAAFRGAWLDSLVAVVYLGSAVGILGWLVRDALAGRIDAGRLTTAVLLVGQLRTAVSGLSHSVHQLARTLRIVDRFRWLQDHSAQQHATHTGSAPAPVALTSGLTLDAVSFRYPGADRDALTDVTVHLPAGEVIAVVGENGAGKSTLIGLLTGMYDLSGGRILIDGQDLRELSLPAWRTRCAGAFQDHLRLERSAREAIGIGGLHEGSGLPDDAELLRALDDAAATDVLAALPNGLDTELGASWSSGVDLSGGQWQRLAIARAMVRDHPLLLVLDEPTSALDPATEHALFERYAAAAQETTRAGGVTLVVTHRFSTVAAADRVIVLADGQVAEQGTHEQLMAARGRYADLYGLQAAGYR